MRVEYQSNKTLSPSPSWEAFISELGDAEKGTSGYWNALEIAEFLELWKHAWDRHTPKKSSKIIRIGKITPPENEFDAKQLLLAFRKRFLPDVENAAEKFSQLENNFEYTYSRSNRRLTFVISLLLVFCFNLPIDVLYKKALETDPESAIKLANTTLGYYNELEKTNLLNNDDPLFQKNLELAKQTIRTTLIEESKKKNVDYLIDGKFIKELFSDYLLFFRYLFGCILTAIMISFGAPFWNDIASTLFRMQKGKSLNKKSPSTEVSNG